jgi:hypothetical protein
MARSPLTPTRNPDTPWFLLEHKGKRWEMLAAVAKLIERKAVC